MNFEVKFKESNQSFDVEFEKVIQLGQPLILPKEITENGTYRATEEGANGYSPVVVNVPIPDGYIEAPDAAAGLAEFPQENYLVNGADLTAVGEAIAAKSGVEKPVFPDGWKEAVEGIPDNYMLYATGLTRMFRFATTMPDKVELYCPRAVTLDEIFAFDNDFPKIEEITLDLGESRPTNMSATFDATRLYVKKITIRGDLSQVKLYNWTFSNRVNGWTNRLAEIDADLDFTSATNVKEMVRYSSELKTIRFVPNTLSLSFSFQWQNKLTTDSLVSIANGLNANASGQTLTLTTSTQDQVFAIMGNNSDGAFVLDDAGTMTLTEFITTVKGWTIA